jgi:hypothetical protein
MERQKYFIALLLLFCFMHMNASYRADIYKAYISNDMNLWKKTIDDMNLKKSKNNDFRIELLNFQYGYIAWCIGNNKKDIAESYIELGEINILILEKTSYNASLVNSYKSAFYGYRIGLNLFKAPFIGPKSVECAKIAMKQDSNNPYGFIQFANSQYYMPPAFGGSKKVALEYFIMAENIMKKKEKLLKDDWNYLSLLAMIAKTYTVLNDYKNAKLYYENILKLEPDFIWVKNELYPELLKKIK